jgi:hypothetical protein
MSSLHCRILNSQLNSLDSSIICQLPSLLTYFRRVQLSTPKVILRLTVSQSVSLGVEPRLGLMTRYVLLFDSYGLLYVKRLLYMLLPLASVVFIGSQSLGTRNHVLLSHLRLPFSSPPTTSRVTMEVFDPASTRVSTTKLKSK